MNDRRATTFTPWKYRNRPSMDADAAAGEWKASLIEKIWVALMAIALTIAAIDATAGDTLANAGDQRANTPLKQVLIDLVAR